MGNWIRVNIVGTCAEAEIDALQAAITPTRDYDNFGPLSSACGLAGLPMWALKTFNVVGNLAERGYDAESVAEHLESIVERVPSLECMVHVGADYESEKCVATVVAGSGKVTVVDPVVKSIGEIPAAQSVGHLFQQLGRRQP
jgi:hypothetical protein